MPFQNGHVHLTTREPAIEFLKRTFPVVWFAAFLYITFVGKSIYPPNNFLLFAVAGTGVVYHLVFSQALIQDLSSKYPALFASAIAMSLAILTSEGHAQFNGFAPPHGLAPQVAELLCLPVLAMFVIQPRYMAWMVGVFAAICAWNFLMIPIEGLTGEKASWHAPYPFPRESGPLKFQASGLAYAPFYFTGLMMPLLYLVWGPVQHKRVFEDAGIPRGLMLALPVLWVIPVICVQSRSALVGAVAAAVLLLATQGRSRSTTNVRLWLFLAVLTAVSAGLYWFMFSVNKSGFDLRWAYMKLYLENSFEWKWIAFGHSYYYDPKMSIPGLVPLPHSHNDFIHILFTWGMVTLVAYLVFWVALLKLIWTRFVRKNEFWPLAAVIAVLPNNLVDLGLHHYEKTMFMVILASMCIAFSEWDLRREKAKAGAPAALEAPPQLAEPEPVAVTP